MQPLSKSEKEKLLSRLFWDLDITQINLYAVLGETGEKVEGIDQQNVYRRLLLSCDWYTLLKILPLQKISAVLNSSVLDELYPQDLKSRYKYARDVLSKQALSSSG